MAKEPISNLDYQEANSLRTDAIQNAELNYWSTWLHPVVLAVAQTAPAGTEVDGDRYIVGVGTDEFLGQDDNVAVMRGGVWQFFAPPTAGVPIVKNLDDGTDWEYVGGTWAEKTGGAAAPTALTIVTEASTSTMTPATHAGTNKYVRAADDVTFNTSESYTAGEVYSIRATAALSLIGTGVTLTAPSGGTLDLDTAMSVTVVMTSPTAADVIGQTVPA